MLLSFGFKHIFVPLNLGTLCGILGIWAKNIKGESEFEKMPLAVQSMSHRGPDFQSFKSFSKISLGHARLSIIDPNDVSNQPMSDEAGRYHLVFNGEIYNFKELKIQLELEGERFKTNSDTEVLLRLLIKKGEKALDLLNGFFAFVFYDQQEEHVFFARDRIGIKPLIIYEDEDKFILASEMSALFQFNIDKTLDEGAINRYFRLTYMPAPMAVLKQAYKILPGQKGTINSEGLTLNHYYKTQRKPVTRVDFVAASDELRSRVNVSIKKRLVSDVPLGAFLSGGLDSSIIAAVAKRYKDDLETFTIGFDHQYFNEAAHANKVAEHIGSKHHEFILGKKEFNNHFEDFLNAIDEPFGDSSAFAVYLLAKETKQHVSVALSGDGADELFGGYRKHLAELASREMSKSRKNVVKGLANLMKSVKVNRSDKLGDFNRKIQKMSSSFELTNEQRYFEWASFIPKEELFYLIEPTLRVDTDWKGVQIDDLNDYLIADQNMVLPNDMLKKVDLMSMAHGLEVRTPFLDHGVVEFANSLPIDYKIKLKAGKLILKHAFREYLPPEILYRRKKGFEIPIQEWLGDKIQEMLNSELFEKTFIEEQGVFDYDYIRRLVKSVNSYSFGDRIYLIWSLIVFQHWYKKYIVE